jgi:hypothetical protein
MANQEILSVLKGLRAKIDALEALVTGNQVSSMPAKPKRVLSDEQKAKMAAGRKAAAERRKAEKALSEASDEEKPKPKRTLSDEQKAKMAAGRKAAAERRKAEKAAEAAEKTEEILVPKSVKGKKLLWNSETGACYERIGESEKGNYLGVLKDGSIDTSVAEEE